MQRRAGLVPVLLCLPSLRICTEDLYTRTCLLYLSYHPSISSLYLLKIRKMRMIGPGFEIGSPIDPKYIKNDPRRVREIAVDKLPFYAQRLVATRIQRGIHQNSDWRDPRLIILLIDSRPALATWALLCITQSPFRNIELDAVSCNLPCRVNVTVDAFLDF